MTYDMKQTLACYILLGNSFRWCCVCVHLFRNSTDNNRNRDHCSQSDRDSFNNTKIFSDFVKIVNSHSAYNQDEKINAIPLIIFHNVAWITNRPYNTNAGLFDQLMKYLYQNHFKVLTYLYHKL